MQQPVCVRRKKQIEKKNSKKSASPKPHHESHSSPATATTSRRRETKRVPRVGPYLLASIDPEFGEIGSYSSRIQKKRRMLRTHAHTDRLIKYWHPVRTPVLVERYMRQEAASCLQQAVCVRRKKNIEEKKTRKNPPSHPKHTTKSTAARRPRHTRDGMQGNTSHALAHTVPLP